MDNLLTREYRTIRSVVGPLLFVERVGRTVIGEIVRILLPSGEQRRGQIIEASDRHAVVQVLEETIGIDLDGTWLRFTEEIGRASCRERV